MYIFFANNIRGGNLKKNTLAIKKKKDKGQEKKENTLSAKKKLFFLIVFLVGFLVESVFSFFFKFSHKQSKVTYSRRICFLTEKACGQRISFHFAYTLFEDGVP